MHYNNLALDQNWKKKNPEPDSEIWCSVGTHQAGLEFKNSDIENWEIETGRVSWKRRINSLHELQHESIEIWLFLTGFLPHHLFPVLNMLDDVRLN